MSEQETSADGTQALPGAGGTADASSQGDVGAVRLLEASDTDTDISSTEEEAEWADSGEDRGYDADNDDDGNSDLDDRECDWDSSSDSDSDNGKGPFSYDNPMPPTPPPSPEHRFFSKNMLQVNRLTIKTPRLLEELLQARGYREKGIREVWSRRRLVKNTAGVLTNLMRFIQGPSYSSSSAWSTAGGEAIAGAARQCPFCVDCPASDACPTCCSSSTTSAASSPDCLSSAGDQPLPAEDISPTGSL